MFRRRRVNKEIERKFAIKYLPSDIEIQEIEKIEQVFIYHDGNTLIRLRKIEASQSVSYIYTVKTKGDIQYDNNYQVGKEYEIESNITKEYYEQLLQKKISNKIIKTRIIVPIQNNLKVEIDIYYDYLEDFLTAEVEFPNEEEANQFDKPNWLGEEIGYQELSNRKLAEMNRKQFESKVSKEVRQHNRGIIEELKQLIEKCY